MYTWIVYLHVLGAFAFALAHGTSMLVAFRVRGTTDVGRLSELLALSQLASRLMYVGFVLLLVGGIWAAFDGAWWDKAWVWLALGVLVAVSVVMYAVATPFYGQMRAAAGVGQGRWAPAEGTAIDPAGLEQLATSRRPEVLALVGGFGLVVILWLMVVKPF